MDLSDFVLDPIQIQAHRIGIESESKIQANFDVQSRTCYANTKEETII